MSSEIPRDILKQLYKAELHCHLDGSMRVETVIELAKEQGVDLPSFKVEELRKVIAVGEDCKSLEEYLIAFDITLRVLQEVDAITRVMYEVCEDAKKDGVRYLEVRFSPILHMQKGLNLSQVMEAVCEGQFLAERKLGIIVRIIVCGMRQMPATISTQLAGIAWRYRNKGVCAFDLAGPEQGFSAHLHRTAFDLIRNQYLNVTLHSGEGAGWESIEDSIQSCGVNRIGHGCKLIQNEKLLQVVANRRIAIEVCPTSNFQTKAVASLDEHPIRHFFDSGIVVVPCCDNWTVSNVTLSGEYELIQKKYGFNLVEILRLMDNGFASAFLEPTCRHNLRQDALRYNLRLLQNSGFDIEPALKHIQFYQVIGPCVDSLSVSNFLGRLPPGSRWGIDPQVSIEVIKNLPKADLHSTLIGSVSPAVVWKGLQERKVDTNRFCSRTFEKYEDFHAFWEVCDPLVIKDLSQEALQTPEMLQMGVIDILQSSVEDGVIYLELAVRPSSHTSSGIMNDNDVIENVLSAMNSFKAKLSHPFWCGIILQCSTTLDDPVSMARVAELAVSHVKKGNAVLGVGFYGRQEIPTDAYKFFKSIFSLLSKNYVPVVIQAGQYDEANVLPALHSGGAQRISGAFMIHKHPRLMAYLASHSIPVELSITETFEESKKNSWALFGSPIRLFLDNGIPLTVCSFRRKKTVSMELQNVVTHCNLDAGEALNLIFNGFRYNFQPFHVREAMQEYARNEAVKTMKGMDFTCFGRRNWMI